MNVFTLLVILLIAYVVLWLCFGTGRKKRRKQSLTNKGRVRWTGRKRRRSYR